jgi:hypothetical protein
MLDIPRKFLESLKRFDLSMLLSRCEVALIETETDNGFFVELIERATVDAPSPIHEALMRLPPQDRKRIAEAIASAYPNRNAPDDISVRVTDAGRIGGAAELLEQNPFILARILRQ